MQTAIDEIREELHMLRSAVLPDAGTDTAAGSENASGTASQLPPVKVPPHMT